MSEILCRSCGGTGAVLSTILLSSDQFETFEDNCDRCGGAGFLRSIPTDFIKRSPQQFVDALNAAVAAIDKNCKIIAKF